MFSIVLLFTCIIGVIPLSAADISSKSSDIPYTHNELVLLSALIDPLKHVKLDDHGIHIMPLNCTIYQTKENKHHILVECEKTTSALCSFVNIWRKAIWINDPKKDGIMPIICHHATQSYLMPDLYKSTDGMVDYKIESYNEKSQSLVVMHYITSPHMFAPQRECSIICDKPVNVHGCITHNTFNTIHKLNLQVQRLTDSYPIWNLCEMLPFLTHLELSNTQLDDTKLNIVHNNLTSCVIENCGLTAVNYLSLPKLQYLGLPHNKITQFDIHILDMHRYKVDLTNNALIVVYTSKHKEPLPPMSINLSENPINIDATYPALFKKAPPAYMFDGLDRSHIPILLKHNNFIVYANGEIEDPRHQKTGYTNI